MTIQKTSVFRARRIDGTHAVLVSIRFGERRDPPSVVRLLTEGTDHMQPNTFM